MSVPLKCKRHSYFTCVAFLVDFKTYQHGQKVGRYAKQYSLSRLHVLSTVEYNMAVVKQSDADTFLLQTDSA